MPFPIADCTSKINQNRNPIEIQTKFLPSRLGGGAFVFRSNKRTCKPPSRINEIASLWVIP